MQIRMEFRIVSLLCLFLTPLLYAQQAPRATTLVEKKFEALSDQNMSEDMKKALAIDPIKWKHAETDNFIVHFRRVTEAQKVVREIEYHLWFVAKALGASKEQYSRKSHIVVFEDESEWKEFLPSLAKNMQWAASIAKGDELFLNVRPAPSSGHTFNSDILAHETTHAVVTRLYPDKHWPIWLNEGFAQYMEAASIAARKNQHMRRYQADLSDATLPLDTLVNMQSYPNGQKQVQQFYASSERIVRFVMSELPADRFPKFVDSILGGAPYDQALISIYGDKLADMDAFRKKYSRFN